MAFKRSASIPSEGRSFTSSEGKMVNWKIAIWAALIAGLVFMMMEMILVTVTGMGRPWGPPRMIAAMVMGQGVLPPPPTFDLGIIMVAMMIHFALSIVYAIILGWIISRWHLRPSLASAVGAAFGLLIYLVNFYGIAPVFFPWFVEARNWVGLLSHVVYGLVLGWAYGALITRMRIPSHGTTVAD